MENQQLILTTKDELRNLLREELQSLSIDQSKGLEGADQILKRTDIAELSHQRIKEFENLLNERPRKRHGFKTPNEVFTGTVTNQCCV